MYYKVPYSAYIDACSMFFLVSVFELLEWRHGRTGLKGIKIICPAFVLTFDLHSLSANETLLLTEKRERPSCKDSCKDCGTPRRRFYDLQMPKKFTAFWILPQGTMRHYANKFLKHVCFRTFFLMDREITHLLV